MKRILPLLLALVLLASATAIADQPLTETDPVVPANAEFIRTGTDDGLTVSHYRTEDGTRYEVKTEPATGRVVKVEIEAADRRGSASAVLNEAQAEQALLAIWPDAVIHLVQPDRDDGRHEYDVAFSTPLFTGKAELNAETGALLEAELFYADEARTEAAGPLTADEARSLVLSLAANGTITEFETDREDGRTVYEGEVRTDSGRYEFVIDAQTGRVTEWETDR